MKPAIVLSFAAVLAACAGGAEETASGRYSAAQERLRAAQAQWDKASAELVAARQRCAEMVDDACVSEAQRLSAELEAAEKERALAQGEIEAARKAQDDAFARGFSIMNRGEPR